MSRLSGGFKRISFNPILARRTSSQSFDEILASGEPALVEALKSVTSFRILSGLRRTDRNACARGGYGDVYKGELLQGWKSAKVAIKVLRFSGDLDFARLVKRLTREIAIWSTLKHVNVLEFIGFEIKGGPNEEEASLVCPWMENGDLKAYLKDKPYCRLRRLLFLLDTLDGLMYLHSRGVYHGDLKAVNILINSNIRGVLCDFGVSRYMDQGNLTTSEGFKGSMRWCSPEQMNSAQCVHTTTADVWSWGMTALEVMTSKVPYHAIDAQGKLCVAISDGDTPNPLDYPMLAPCDGLWTLFRGCWKEEPGSRSTLSDLRPQVLALICNKTTKTDLEFSDPLTRGDAIASLKDNIVHYREASSGAVESRDLATALVDLGSYLAEAGRHAEALQRHEEAAALWRSLTAKHPETFELELAQSVQLLSKRLAAAGQWNKGLEQAQKGDAMLQTLAEKDPEAFRPARASSLLNLSDRLADAGRRDEALDMAEQAAAMAAELVKESHGTSQEYIPFLISYSSRLQDVGRRKEALEQAWKAHYLAHTLAEGPSDRYQSILASCLHKLSACEEKLCHYADALVHIERAVESLRKLVEVNPEVFRPQLAASLITYEWSLDSSGLKGDALSIGLEGVAMWRGLVEQEPASFHPDLSKALYWSSRTSWNVHQYESALEYIQEAVAIQEKLADEVPWRFLSDQGVWCCHHSYCLRRAGRIEEAIKTAKRAVDILQPFADTHPDAFRSKLSGALTVLSKCLMENDKSGEALPHLRAAVELDKGYEGTGPVGKLSTLARCLSKLGENDDALQTIKKAVDMARKWARDHPNASSQSILAWSLLIASDCLMECGRSEEAIQRGRESMDLYELLAQQQPGSYLSHHTSSGSNLTNHLQTLGRNEEALQIKTRAADFRHRLSA